MVLFGLVMSVLTGSAEADGCHEVGVSVTTGGTIVVDGTEYTCESGFDAICQCKPDSGAFDLTLKVCGATPEAATTWYKDNVLPLLQNNFKNSFGPDVYQAAGDPISYTWAAYGHNETMYKKMNCKLKSSKSAKDAFCNKDFIYGMNGIQSCEGSASDTTCAKLTPSCLSIEDKLYENCDAVSGGPGLSAVAAE